MTGPYGIPYEELAMQQQEAKESLPYTMREVRQALVKLPPKDRHGIIFALDSGQAEIERLTELIESRDAEIHAMYAPVVEFAETLFDKVSPLVEGMSKEAWPHGYTSILNDNLLCIMQAMEDLDMALAAIKEKP